MKILKDFREWLAGAEEKEKFVKHWIDKNKSMLDSWSSASKDYHASVSYEFAQMQAQIEAMQKSIDALSSAQKASNVQVV